MRPLRTVPRVHRLAWTLLIVWALKPRLMRFTALLSVVPGVNTAGLTRSLRDLERDGLVSRRYVTGVPPLVEYAMTDLISAKPA
jgi:DNA-binding HxlR family transcriptional regulator